MQNEFGRKEFSLNADDKSKLLEMYKRELSNQSLDDLANTEPVATLLFQIDHYVLSYYVYPSFASTVDFLENHGFNTARVIGENDIKEIVVRNLNTIIEDDLERTNGAVEETIAYSVDKELEHTKGMKTYTDIQSIQEIRSSLVSGDYYWNNHMLIKVEESIEVFV